jgi:dihydrofolate reductase
METALEIAKEHTGKTHGQVFVVGGAQVYSQAIRQGRCIGVLLTEIVGPMAAGDTFFPVSDLKSDYCCKSFGDLAYSLIQEKCKGLQYSEGKFVEKDYQYEINIYCRNQ